MTVEYPQYTPESCREADLLKAYCETKFPLGMSTVRALSVTGEPYTEFPPGHFLGQEYGNRFDTAEAARIAAQSHFDDYTKDKTGTLYWRVLPEIAMQPRSNKFGYYMRFLISDKPEVGHAT